ncbi:hypothetical protein CDO73_08735, partial [Saccharibacillus sp. O23]
AEGAAGARQARCDVPAEAGWGEAGRGPGRRREAGAAASGGSADLTGRAGPPSPGEAPGGSPRAEPASGLSDPRPLPGLLVVEPAMLREPGVPESARAFAAAGGAVLVLPCDETHGDVLTRLLARPTRIVAHEAYQLEADYGYPLAEGLSPADLFGLDKVHHSPRDLNNLGEGLYGWMKKKERGPQDGRMRIQDSAGGLWFLSAFVLPAAPDKISESVSETDCETEVRSRSEDSAAFADDESDFSAVPVRLRVESNALSARLWLNGRPLQGPHPVGELLAGVNRLIVEARAGAEDLALAVFFEHPDGRPLEGLRYRMTIDEVEPK